MPAAQTVAACPALGLIPGRVIHLAPWQGPAGGATQNIPYPDPQESNVHMADQINTTPPMMGFVNDYCTVTNANPADIMHILSLKTCQSRRHCKTELTPTEIQVLANLTAWTVMTNATKFQAMYKQAMYKIGVRFIA